MHIYNFLLSSMHLWKGIQLWRRFSYHRICAWQVSKHRKHLSIWNIKALQSVIILYVSIRN